MATPHKCPTCDGRGTMPWWHEWPWWSGLDERFRKCRTCNGSGIVWEPDLPIVKARYATETHST